jgi:hypothetical protein
MWIKDEERRRQKEGWRRKVEGSGKGEWNVWQPAD